jgi:hypothetical protein
MSYMETNEMDRLDFVKQDKWLYTPGKKPEIVAVPIMQYLMFDGEGMPETNPLFQQAFGALYGVAYTIKFMGKKGTMPIGWQDFKIPPPEGLWWMADDHDFDQAKPQLWRWTLMLRMPDFVTKYLVRVASENLVIKKKDEIYNTVRLESLSEGRCVQIMHIGPYENEAEDLAAMAAYAEAEGYQYIGKHHEIYFGDPRRTKPEKLRTLLRHPVSK